MVFNLKKCKNKKQMNGKWVRLIFMVLGFNNSIGNTSNYLIVTWTQVSTSKWCSMPDCLHKIVKYVVDTVEVSFVSEKKKKPKIWKEWEEIHRVQWMSEERVSVEESLHFSKTMFFPVQGPLTVSL